MVVRLFIAAVLALILHVGSSAPLIAQHGPPVAISERAHGAERVFVGKVASVDPYWQRNEHGDELIVSRVRVDVDEVLKGAKTQTATLDIDGGSLDGLTLRVSDLPTLAGGDRAVFFVRRDSRGEFVPHLRGLGILQLDKSDRVMGTSLTLSDVRNAARVRP